MINDRNINTTMDMPTTALSSGLIVANFSSPHHFQFTDGSILRSCHEDRSRTLMLHTNEVESPGINGTTDIELSFSMSDEVLNALLLAQARKGVHIVVVPLPVMLAMHEEGVAILNCRSIRMADRVAKTVHIDRWCKK